MKLCFDPTALSSVPFNDLTAGQCFYDTAERAWVAIFAMAPPEPNKAQRFIVPLVGERTLIASPLLPESEDNGVKRVLAFNLKDSFDIRFDSTPTDDTQSRTTSARPLLILRNGPTIQTEIMRNLSIPAQRAGFLLNLATFNCDYAHEHLMEIHDATSIERWSLIFKAEPNLGTVFFPQSSPQAAA